MVCGSERVGYPRRGIGAKMKINLGSFIREKITGTASPEKIAGVKKYRAPGDKTTISRETGKEKSAPNRLNPIQEAAVKNRLLEELWSQNPKINPGPEVKAQVTKNLSLYPAGCLKLVKDFGAKTEILQQDQSIMDTGLIKKLDSDKYRDPERVASLRQEVDVLMGQFAGEIAKIDKAKDNRLEREQLAEKINFAFFFQFGGDLIPAAHYPKSGLYQSGISRSGSSKQALNEIAIGEYGLKDYDKRAEWLELAEKLNPQPDLPYLLLPNFTDPSQQYNDLDACSMRCWDIEGKIRGEYFPPGRGNAMIIREGKIEKTSGLKTDVHEFAHALCFAVGEKDPETMKTFESKAKKKLREHLFEPHRAVSSYALSSPSEFEAEGINAFIVNPKELKELDKEWYRTVKNFVAKAAELGEAGKGAKA